MGLELSLFLLGVDGVNADLLVVFFKSREVLSRFREFAFLHTLADVLCDSALAVTKAVTASTYPVHEGSL